MQRPQTLQFLKHGKILCRAVFGRFVETWNWLVSAFDNLHGDGDKGPGYIVVDKTVSGNPCIRFDAQRFLRNCNVVVDGNYVHVPGNFEPEFEDVETEDETSGETVTERRLSGVGEGFWPFGRMFYHEAASSAGGGITVDNSAKRATGFIFLRIDHQYDSAQSSIGATATVCGASQFVNTGSREHSFIPLYRIAGGAMVVDFRSCMSLTVRELVNGYSDEGGSST